MSTLSELKPTQKRRLIDLVSAAGVDTSDWANFKGGKAKAAANPKYCYEWSFVVPKKLVVLNLWHDQMEESHDGIVFMELNPREFASRRQGIESFRGLKMDEALKITVKDKLPVRVIVLGGRRRNINNPGERASHVSDRLLDLVNWTVTAYDSKTGQCTLTRGAEWENAVDDLSAPPEGNQFPDRANVVVQVIKRDNRVRAHAIKRANGKCEYCGVQGFPTTNGYFYVEAHHIIALCDSGRDTVDNVIALCPQHHRQAHYGNDAESLELGFIKILKRLNRQK